MTARHSPSPAPSKRSQRRARRQTQHFIALVQHMIRTDPGMRASMARTAAAVDALIVRSHRVQWLLGPRPMPAGMVTWDTRRRRSRR